MFTPFHPSRRSTSPSSFLYDDQPFVSVPVLGWSRGLRDTGIKKGDVGQAQRSIGFVTVLGRLPGG